MNQAETALRAVLKVVQDYLPPDGIAEKDAFCKIIEIVDPWPLSALASRSTEPGGEAEPGIALVNEETTLQSLKSVMQTLSHEDRHGNLWDSSTVAEKAIALKVVRAFFGSGGASKEAAPEAYARICEAQADRWKDERAIYVAHECAKAIRAHTRGASEPAASDCPAPESKKVYADLCIPGDPYFAANPAALEKK